MTFLADIDALHGLEADLVRFTALLQIFADKLELDLSAFSADHISLRCHQNATAERWRSGFETCSSLLSENMINGRPICLFDLHQPLSVGPWQIDCVELPYPGEKRYPHEGWEHVELVIAGDPETLHPRALELLSDSALRAPGIKLKFSSPKGDSERLPNPTLAVTDGEITIKFHPYSIREIVASEQQ